MTKDKAIKLLRRGEKGVLKWNAQFKDRRLVHSADSLILKGADLQSAKLSGVRLAAMDLCGANFRNSYMIGLDCRRSDLREVDFSGALLIDANFVGADLSFANFDKAILTHANFTAASAWDATFRGAQLGNAILKDIKFGNADFSGCVFGSTAIASDLSQAKGLDSTVHTRPSQISTDTILRFNGDLPEIFLRGCGLRDEEIAYFRSVVGNPIRFYSCFISYSTKDEAIAGRLHNDFQAAGIRCWKWNHDARTGRPLWDEIDIAVRHYDKLVLIASESSLKSDAVNREIEIALRKEDELRSLKAAGQPVDSWVLFPVRTDDYVFDGWEHHRKRDVTDKVVADARAWDKDQASYNAMLRRLIRDLKSEM